MHILWFLYMPALPSEWPWSLKVFESDGRGYVDVIEMLYMGVLLRMQYLFASCCQTSYFSIMFAL